MSDQDISELLDAAKNGNVQQMSTLLNKGHDPNAKDASGSTSLHLAAKEKHSEIVELLLIYGADPDVREISGSTPLHHAVRIGDDKIAQLLLEYVANPNIQDNDGTAPLHLAAKGTNIFLVKLLIDCKADLQLRDNTGSKPYSYAVQKDISDLVNGIPVTIQQRVETTPVFPIIINGIMINEIPPLDERFPPARHRSEIKTAYILVQSRTRLNPSESQDLERIGVKRLDYVSKNTYLCEYTGATLDPVRGLSFVVFADIYHKEFKTGPNLKQALRYKSTENQSRRIDAVFHKGQNPPNLEKELVETSHCGDQIVFSSSVARLSTEDRYIDAIASIDEVRLIEEVREVVMFNDHARQILGFDTQQTAQVQQYRGRGQLLRLQTPAFARDKGSRFTRHSETA